MEKKEAQQLYNDLTPRYQHFVRSWMLKTNEGLETIIPRLIEQGSIKAYQLEKKELNSPSEGLGVH